MVHGKLQIHTFPLLFPPASKQGVFSSVLYVSFFKLVLDLSTEWMKVPSVHLGYIPWTGHPKLHVHVAHLSSLSIEAPLVICFPVLRSQNSSSQAPQVDCMKQLSRDTSIWVMYEECFCRGLYFLLKSPVSSSQSYTQTALSCEPIRSKLYPNLMSDIHYFACLNVTLHFISQFLGLKLKILTLPSFEPTMTNLLSGVMSTLLPLEPSTKSLVFLSISIQKKSLESLLSMMFKEAELRSLRLLRLQHRTVASSEQLKTRSPLMVSPQTSLVHELLGLQWHFIQLVILLGLVAGHFLAPSPFSGGSNDLVMLGTSISNISDPKVPTSNLFSMQSSDRTEGLQECRLDTGYLVLNSGNLALRSSMLMTSKDLLRIKMKPSLVPAPMKSYWIVSDSTTEVLLYYYFSFGPGLYAYSSVLMSLISPFLHEYILPPAAPVKTMFFLISIAKLTNTYWVFPYLNVRLPFSTVQYLKCLMPTDTNQVSFTHPSFKMTFFPPFLEETTVPFLRSKRETK